MEMQSAGVILCTVPNEKTAEKIARSVVERKLAACVNIIPQLRSIYSWQGKIEDDRELLLVIKTSHERYDALESAIVELHPYDTPEVLLLPIAKGLNKYLDWLSAQITE